LPYPAVHHIETPVSADRKAVAPPGRQQDGLDLVEQTRAGGREEVQGIEDAFAAYYMLSQFPLFEKGYLHPLAGGGDSRM